MSLEKTLMDDHILILDTETTGFVPTYREPLYDPLIDPIEKYPYITQISAILYSLSKRKIVRILNEYVKKPAHAIISEGAKKVTGITDEMCEEKGRPLIDILLVLYEMVVSCRTLVAHNYEFDARVLRAEIFRNREQLPNYCWLLFQEHFHAEQNIRVVCTMRSNTNFCQLKNLKWPKLIELYRILFGCSTVTLQLHNSLVDSLVCLRCFLKTDHDMIIPDAEFERMMQIDYEGYTALSTFVSSRTRNKYGSPLVVLGANKLFSYNKPIAIA